MRVPSRAAAVILAFSFSVSCGSGIVKVEVKPVKVVGMSTSVNAFAAGSEAVLARRRDAFIWASAYHAPEPVREQPVPVTSLPTPASEVTDALGPWACIAEAETGSDWTMHGSTYSTAFGMVNDIIYDYGTPEEQQAVFSGTATREQQIDIASRFAADHGFGGWGELTKQKCGL